MLLYLHLKQHPSRPLSKNDFMRYVLISKINPTSPDFISMSQNRENKGSDVLSVGGSGLFVSCPLYENSHKGLVIFLGILNHKASQKNRGVSSSGSIYDHCDFSVTLTGKRVHCSRRGIYKGTL